MHGRTAQGTVAWIVSMIAVPWVAIPFYWIAGRRRFSGYIHARRAEDAGLRRISDDLHRRVREYAVEPGDRFSRAAEHLGGLPFTRGNRLDLLIDGRETFDALFEAIHGARRYLLINFFIVKNDLVGQRFRRALIDKARAGVRVYFLFDEIGSHKLSHRYLRELTDAGVECRSFGVNRHWWSRFQINFRNHRKIVVIDGDEAYLGGLNVGEEYLGRDERFGGWRDTHLRLRGPSVQAVQLVFLEDWNWAAGSLPPDLGWAGDPEDSDQTAVILPTGPADRADSWQLIVAETANTAEKRLWIASPYFVPDPGVLTALQTAALRGVDVRILIPEKADHLTVWLAAFSFYRDVLPYGVRIMRYQTGFLHQKVMLVDDRYAFVGTANLDNRSFRLNFEITALSTDPVFIDQVTRMLERDLENACSAKLSDLDERSFPFLVAVRVARLFAPIL
jgi:cardiolipin synthase